MTPHPKLRLYQPSPEADMALCAWWSRLVEIGELEQTFGRGAACLSAFLAHFQPPSTLLYACDEAGEIALGFRLSPMLDARAVTVWLSPAWRHLPIGVAVLESAYELALEQHPVLLGITRQPRLLAIHRRWGYGVLGRLPAVFDGHDGWVVMLTSEAYERAKTAGRRRQPRLSIVKGNEAPIAAFA